MNILVTSGSTITMIDKVRGITNIFRGRTGFKIAEEAVYRGHSVTLIANPVTKEWAELMTATPDEGMQTFEVLTYKTFDELEMLMRKELWKQNIMFAFIPPPLAITKSMVFSKTPQRF